MKSTIVCRDFERMLSAYIDHEASADEMRMVEDHARECEACSSEMPRMQRLAGRLDSDLRALLNDGEQQTRTLNRSFRPPPDTLFGQAVSPPMLSRLSTVAIVLVFATFVGIVLFRSAPTGQPLQTASQPGVTTITPVGPQPDFAQALWNRVLDPTTAYVFFVLGLYAIFLEIAHPGTLVPGITGVLCMLLAAIAFAGLPINWPGVSALIAGVGLIALEMKFAKHGLLLLCGVACMGLGSVVLYRDVVIAPAVVVGMMLLGTVSGVFIVGLARRVHDLPPLNPLEELIGARGVSRTTLDPDGVVQVRGQSWSAHARGGPLPAGETVRIVARRGLVLDVESASFRAAATQKGAYS